MKTNENGNTNTNTNTNKLINATILVSLLVIVSLLSNLPVLQLVSIAVAPIIVVLIYVRSDIKYTIISFFVSMIMISILLNPIQGITLTILNYIIGIGLIWAVRKEYSAFTNIIILSVALIIGVSLFTFLNLKLVLRTDISGYLNMIMDTFDEAFEMMVAMYKDMDIDISDNPAFNQLKNISLTDILKLIPVYITLYSVIVSTFIYKVSEKILGRLNIKIKAMPKLSYIKSNIKLIIIGLSIAMIGLVVVSINLDIGEAVSLFGRVIFEITGAVGGISVVSYLLEEKLNYRAFLRYLFLFLILVSGLNLVLVLIGIVDSAFDFRQIENGGLYSTLKNKINEPSE